MIKIKWLSHACWLIDFGDLRIIIDPFLTGNPKAPVGADEVKNIKYVLVTHNHFDHINDAFKIARNNNAKVIGIYELTMYPDKDGFPDENIIGMNKGSLSDLGDISIGMVNAVHSGNESGFIIRKNGVTIYHAGDTAFFGDMKYIKEFYHPDIAMLPIGGFYTMGPMEAARAAELIGAKITFPMHYGTFPAIDADPKKFKELSDKYTKVVILNPGDEYIFE
ncbi:metal-dependent hydrolase [Acidiplasma sp.]|jgi:L-ascorbate metabolism protein UlaG (beta-lactamase superfamily)|uniref:metal-dependent hydrolase n=1 Tax=Acidiplasma TaxID=507753 RepID=UPI0025899C5C|nr:metal-dependent hydrolase [Acidiplasma sp.]